MVTKKQTENTSGKSTAKQKSNAGKMGDEKSAAKSSLKLRETESQGENTAAKQPTKKLNAKQLKYVEAVIATSNGKDAAIAAGYSSRSAKTIASQSKARPEICQRIAERLEALTSWTANEGLGALVEYSRADISQFFNDDGSFIGMTNLRLRGLGYLIKSIEFKRSSGADDEPVEIVKLQLYDAVEAQKSLLSYVMKPLKRDKKEERHREFYESLVNDLSAKFNLPREKVVADLVSRRPDAAKYLLNE